jgi:hypothetical protein
MKTFCLILIIGLTVWFTGIYNDLNTTIWTVRTDIQYKLAQLDCVTDICISSVTGDINPADPQ